MQYRFYLAADFSRLISAGSFQQPIYFDFSPGTKVDATAHHDGNYKTRRHRCSIALAVLLRSINRLAEFGSVESVEHRWSIVGPIPRFGRDRPDNRVLVPVGGDRWCRARIFKLHGGRCIEE